MGIEKGSFRIIAYSCPSKGYVSPYAVKTKQGDDFCEVKRTALKRALTELKLAERGEDKFEKESNP